MDNSGKSALGDVNVLDLSTNIAGAYCSKLFADLGAAVIMVEHSDGHPLRHVGPFPNNEPHLDKSGMFMYLCANKRSIVAEPYNDDHAQKTLELVSQVDLVIQDEVMDAPGSMAYDWEILETLNHMLVMTSITHFGQTGPYRDWQSDEIVDYAMGGYMYFGGHRDREPLMLTNNQAQLNAGAQAAIASLAAIWRARRDGRGQHIDVSTVEAMLSAHAWTSTSWTHEGVIMRRSEPDSIPCKDGYVWLMSMRWDPTLFVLIERPDLMDDPRFADRQSWFENRDELLQLVGRWCAQHTKDYIFHAAQELRLALTPVNNAADLLKSDQLKARDWFQEIEHLDAGTFTLPGFPYLLSETPASIRSPAPRLGQHDGAEFIGTRERGHRSARHALEPDKYAGRELPLMGIRVLEITANWAGPLAGRFLADLGAEVIKIEPPDRPMTRGARYPGGDPFKRHYNRAAYFNKMNRNKYGITLDLNQDEGKRLFMELIADSDVLIENNSPRVMRNFGLEYEMLTQANPDLVMLSISGFGQTGPERDYIAYGANIEASCGLADATGYPDDDRPYKTSLFYADPVTAMHGAVAILAALHNREQRGGGQFIDMSLHENGITFFPEAFMEHTVTGNLARRRGNRHPRYAPQGCYPSIGDDAWMVLTVRDDDEWVRLALAIGRDDLAESEKYATAEKRRAHHDEIDEAISEWTSQYDHNEASQLLQDAGVAAGPVLANWELVSNHHFYERGFYIPVPHSEMGVFPYPGMPWIFSQTPGAIRMAAPNFGEHNRLIFDDFLKVSDRKMSELYEKRVIADSPPDDLPGPIRLPR
jgi:crotonobetainyl-CoA:carnitine CoA-transferase CaiB-like acyl-CoA transferase